MVKYRLEEITPDHAEFKMLMPWLFFASEGERMKYKYGWNHAKFQILQFRLKQDEKIIRNIALKTADFS